MYTKTLLLTLFATLALAAPSPIEARDANIDGSVKLFPLAFPLALLNDEIVTSLKSPQPGAVTANAAVATAVSEITAGLVPTGVAAEGVKVVGKGGVMGN